MGHKKEIKANCMWTMRIDCPQKKRKYKQFNLINNNTKHQLTENWDSICVGFPVGLSLLIKVCMYIKEIRILNVAIRIYI